MFLEGKSKTQLIPLLYPVQLGIIFLTIDILKIIPL